MKGGGRRGSGGSSAESSSWEDMLILRVRLEGFREGGVLGSGIHGVGSAYIAGMYESRYGV